MKMKRIWAAILILTLAFCAPVALADDTVRVDCAPLILDGEWTDGEMRSNEYHYYSFTVAEVGKVTLRVQTCYANAHFELLDADLVNWKDAYLHGSQGSPETYDFICYLEPGDYVLRNDGGTNIQGDYRIKAILEPCASDESEPNDDYHSAQPMTSAETYSGVLTARDKHDYYTFTLSQETEVHLTVNSESKEQQVLSVYDGDMVKLNDRYDLRGYAEDLLLPAGAYYLDVQSGTGPYTIKVIY